MKQRGFEVVTKYNDLKINLPKRGSKTSAGYDFYNIEEIVIKAKEACKIPTGIKAYMLADEVLEIHVRSSLGIKGISMLNTVGIIDSDYYNNPKNEGEIIIFLKNNTNEDITFAQDERLVQGIFKKYLTTDQDDVTTERLGGFGSTNK
ncbi:MAG: deoxyuridine 5'-triphosphate nucleotidohydrolase [Mycoplasmatales bacterium]